MPSIDRPSFSGFRNHTYTHTCSSILQHYTSIFETRQDKTRQDKRRQQHYGRECTNTTRHRPDLMNRLLPQPLSVVHPITYLFYSILFYSILYIDVLHYTSITPNKPRMDQCHARTPGTVVVTLPISRDDVAICTSPFALSLSLSISVLHMPTMHGFCDQTITACRSISLSTTLQARYSQQARPVTSQTRYQ